jgi:hypothetical protein
MEKEFIWRKVMYRIAITGKANTGKNTVGKLLTKGLYDRSNVEGWNWPSGKVQFIAFADPLKKMARLAFPEIPRKWLYGSSKYRSQVIPGAFKEGVPLTVRQLLIDLGNDFGRKYKSSIWIDNFDHGLEKLYKKNPKIAVVTDCRFRNEFDHLKNLGFFQIRVLRDAYTKINDVSETNQDGIMDSEFDVVINNSGTKDQLKTQVDQIIVKLQ